MLPPIPVVLSFAASDPTSGAGLQADLMTFSVLGCHGVSVVTGITVQDSLGVQAVHPLRADWLKQQAQVLLADIPVAAFKLGVIGSVENAYVIAAVLNDYPDLPVVFDPVLSSGRGEVFADAALIEVMKKYLLPRATVVTPNSVELRHLAWGEEYTQKNIESSAQKLLLSGCAYVLVTGGHETGASVVNRLFHKSGEVSDKTTSNNKPHETEFLEIQSQTQCGEMLRLPGAYHGSGCTFSSALAAFLAHGESVEDAARRAQQYTWHTLQNALKLGKGQQIPNRFFALPHVSY